MQALEGDDEAALRVRHRQQQRRARVSQATGPFQERPHDPQNVSNVPRAHPMCEDPETLLIWALRGDGVWVTPSNELLLNTARRAMGNHAGGEVLLDDPLALRQQLYGKMAVEDRLVQALDSRETTVRDLQSSTASLQEARDSLWRQLEDLR